MESDVHDISIIAQLPLYVPWGFLFCTLYFIFHV